MKVYRAMALDKLQDLKRNRLCWHKSDHLIGAVPYGETREIGSPMPVGTKNDPNSFEYKDDTHYIHFYKKYKDAREWLETFLSTNCPSCIVVVEIDDEQAKQYEGTGHYGYKNSSELAIPLDEFDLAWIEQVLTDREIEEKENPQWERR